MSDFDAKWAVLSGARWPTFRRALSMLPDKPRVCETGCVRYDPDPGDGHSTLILADWAKRGGGSVDSVDLSEANLAVCRSALQKRGLMAAARLHHGDSVAYLKARTAPVDMVYLDSADYSVQSPAQAERAQRHCLAELMAASKLLGPGSLVLIDDANFAGGGKPLLAKDWLADHGWKCLLEAYQSLWTRSH